MHLNKKLKSLDDSLCRFFSSKDPLKKLSIKNVFMDKKQLEFFYDKMLSKYDQQINLQQKKNIQFDNDRNKLLRKQENRIVGKIYNRSFYHKNVNYNALNLSQKENVKVNVKPSITETVFKVKPLQEGKRQKFLHMANEQLLATQHFAANNQKSKYQRGRALSQSMVRRKKNSTHHACGGQNLISNKFESTYDESVQQDSRPARRAQLIQLYQRLYNQFQIQKLKYTGSKQKIQGKYSKVKLQIKRPKVKQSDVPT